MRNNAVYFGLVLLCFGLTVSVVFIVVLNVIMFSLIKLPALLNCMINLKLEVSVLYTSFVAQSYVQSYINIVHRLNL